MTHKRQSPCCIDEAERWMREYYAPPERRDVRSNRPPVEHDTDTRAVVEDIQRLPEMVGEPNEGGPWSLVRRTEVLDVVRRHADAAAAIEHQLSGLPMLTETVLAAALHDVGMVRSRADHERLIKCEGPNQHIESGSVSALFAALIANYNAAKS